MIRQYLSFAAPRLSQPNKQASMLLPRSSTFKESGYVPSVRRKAGPSWLRHVKDRSVRTKALIQIPKWLVEAPGRVSSDGNQ